MPSQETQCSEVPLTLLCCLKSQCRDFRAGVIQVGDPRGGNAIRLGRRSRRSRCKSAHSSAFPVDTSALQLPRDRLVSSRASETVFPGGKLNPPPGFDCNNVPQTIIWVRNSAAGSTNAGIQTYSFIFRTALDAFFPSWALCGRR